ncbi:MAG: hypothetical protein KA807_11965 [Prolixibacteraceae bacterium]|nr:hypothetical protein [Prolixibacteraceae bacterium]
MIDNKTIDWLLDSDVSIQYQVYRDLLDTDRPEIKERISKEGWGANFLSLRQNNGHWGLGFYQPKWTSSHYTLLDLRHLEISTKTREIKETIRKIIDKDKGTDGGINPSGTIKQSDVCINGMFLNYASYFESREADLESIIDFIISQQLPDGGFNCQFNRQGARHSSLHSTLSMIEGIHEYSRWGYRYRLDELKKIEKESYEFILAHRLYKSHRTGEIIDKKMVMLSYPSRWRYDILRALDYFQFAKFRFDERMTDALDVLIKKQRSDKKWPLQAKHTGNVHFDMENVGEPSRWNTLRALRVLKHFDIINKTK